MKKLLVLALVGLAATAVQAGPYYHRDHGHYRHGHHGWVAPMVLGGVVTYALTRPQPPVIVQQPMVVPQYPPVVPYGYHYENILDANCNCYRLVLVQN